MIAFVMTASLIAAISEKGLCRLVECDMELVGYVFNDPIIIFFFLAISIVLCFIPSVWLSKNIGRNVSIGIIPLIFAVLVTLLGVKNNSESSLIVGLWVFVPLLFGNIVGLLLWPKLSASLVSENA